MLLQNQVKEQAGPICLSAKTNGNKKMFYCTPEANIILYINYN